MDPASHLRISDEEREQAARMIREHYAAGRLSEAELDERLQAVYGARTQADLAAVRADLPALPASPAQQKAELVRWRHQLQRQLLQQAGGGLGLFVLCTVIWAVSGGHHGQFWPIWVALLAVMPLIRNGWRLYGPAPDLEAVERDLARHAGRRGRRASRRAIDRG
jgi:Domain of unknown function (DUF1707)